MIRRCEKKYKIIIRANVLVHVEPINPSLAAALPESIFVAVIEAWVNLFYGSPEAPKSCYDCLSARVATKNVFQSLRRLQCMHRDDIELLYGCH